MKKALPTSVAEIHWLAAKSQGKKWTCQCGYCREQRRINKASDAKCVKGVDYV